MTQLFLDTLGHIRYTERAVSVRIGKGGGV